MALDPRTQMAQAQSQEKDSSILKSCPSKPPITKFDNPRQMTAKRRKLHALTEALFDPCTTIQEADLDALMLEAKRRTPRNLSGS